MVGIEKFYNFTNAIIKCLSFLFVLNLDSKSSFYKYKKYIKKQSQSNNIKRKKNLTYKQRIAIEKKHNKLKKTAKGDMYTIENSYGYFSVCVQNNFNYDEIGLASYYDCGYITATGEKFSYQNYTAAHPYLPLPCVAEISTFDYPRKKILVKVNDRGPFIQNEKVIIDLTARVARILGFHYHGLKKVRVKVLIKETMMLSEYGGEVFWDGSTSFSQAIFLSRNKKQRIQNLLKSKTSKQKIITKKTTVKKPIYKISKKTIAKKSQKKYKKILKKRF